LHGEREKSPPAKGEKGRSTFFGSLEGKTVGLRQRKGVARITGGRRGGGGQSNFQKRRKKGRKKKKLSFSRG